MPLILHLKLRSRGVFTSLPLPLKSLLYSKTYVATYICSNIHQYVENSFSRRLDICLWSIYTYIYYVYTYMYIYSCIYAYSIRHFCDTVSSSSLCEKPMNSFPNANPHPPRLVNITLECESLDSPSLLHNLWISVLKFPPLLHNPWILIPKIDPLRHNP